MTDRQKHAAIGNIMFGAGLGLLAAWMLHQLSAPEPDYFDDEDETNFEPDPPAETETDA